MALPLGPSVPAKLVVLFGLSAIHHSIILIGTLSMDRGLFVVFYGYQSPPKFKLVVLNPNLDFKLFVLQYYSHIRV